MAQLLDGKTIAGKLYDKLESEVGQLKTACGRAPVLLSVQVGTHSASDLFTRSQERAASRLGIGYKLERLPEAVTQEELLRRIAGWNQEPSITGVTIQLPLPKGIDARTVSAALDPRKDVEGIHPQHIGQSMFGWSRIGTCTSLAVMELIDSTGVDLYGKKAVIVGHSELIGKPVSLMLLDRFCTTTVCHIGTAEAGDLDQYIQQAEVLVVAVGKAHLVKGSSVRKGAIVVDVGINLVDGKLKGDVDFEGASKRAQFITPVPGGVGPVVVATLMRNTVEAFKLQQK